MKIIKEELLFEENLKKRLEFICEFSKVTPTFVNGSIRKNDKVIPGYYSRGDSSEIFMYLDRYGYLLITMPRLHEYVIENLMKNKKSHK